MFFVLHANVCGKSLPHHGHSHDNGHGHSHGGGHAHNHDDHDTEPLNVDVLNGDEPEQAVKAKKPATNINVRAAIIHVIGDFVQSVGVLCAAILIKFKVSERRRKVLCNSCALFLAWVQISGSHLHFRLFGACADHHHHDHAGYRLRAHGR